MEEKKINNIEKTADEIYSDAPGLDPELPWGDVFPTEELSDAEKAIERSEDLLFEKLFGELGRRFIYFESNGDEKAELVKKTPKDITTALEYIPNHLALLKALFPECCWPCSELVRFVDDMKRAEYTSEDIEAFCLTWIDAAEELGMLDEMQMHFYLLGGYYYYGNFKITVPTKKDFNRALEFIPKWLHELKIYDTDEELYVLVSGMRKVGYSDSEITLFATRYITELDMSDKLWYSSIHMHLFSEHNSGAYIDIEGLGDFEKAIELLPRYVDYITHFDKSINEMQSNFDPDMVLYSLIVDMRKHGFSEEKISRFATEWMIALEKTENDSFMRMFAYLFGEYYNAFSTGDCKAYDDKTTLINMKDFSKALAYIPSWMAFLNDNNWQFGYYPEPSVSEILKKMRDAGYGAEKIEEFLLCVVECDKSIIKICRALYKNGKYEAVDSICKCEIPELMNTEKYDAFAGKHGDGTIGGVFMVEYDGTLIKYIGEDVEHIDLPPVKRIAYLAFCELEKLTSIHIPAEVEAIDTYSFARCNNLETITVDSANPVFYSEGNCLIEIRNCGLSSTGEPYTVKSVVLKGKNAVVPDGVKDYNYFG